MYYLQAILHILSIQIQKWLSSVCFILAPMLNLSTSPFNLSLAYFILLYFISICTATHLNRAVNQMKQKSDYKNLKIHSSLQ